MLDNKHPFIKHIIQEAFLPFCRVISSIDETLDFLALKEYPLDAKSVSDIASFQRFVHSDFCREIKRLGGGTLQ